MGFGNDDLNVDYIPQYNDPLSNEFYSQVLEGLEGGIPRYRGKLVADLTPMEKAGIAGLGTLGEGPMGASRMDVIGSALSNDLPFEVGPEVYDEYYRTAIEPLARSNFEDMIQQILHRTASGGSSGNVTANLGKALTNFELGLAAQKSGIALQGAERKQDLLMANRGMIPGLLSSSRAEEAFGPAMKLQAGGYQRANDQANLNAKFQQWQMQQAYNNPWLGFVQSAVSGVQPYPVYGGSSSGISPWLSMIPAAGGFMQGISSFF